MMAQLSKICHVSAKEGLGITLKVCVYFTVLILGIMAAYYYEHGAVSVVKDSLMWKGLMTIYNRLGCVSICIIPLVIYQIVLTTQDILHNKGYVSKPAWSMGYYLVIFVAPYLGIYGTFDSLGDAVKTMDISQGLQHALGSLGMDIGRALDSTKVGIAQAVLAYPSLLILNKKQTDKDPEEV
jgi:hypothetical protein